MNNITNKCFCDIINGYSIALLNNHTIYIKHFSIFDQLIIDEFRAKKFSEALIKQLPLEKDKLLEIKKSDIWTKQDEEDYVNVKFELDGFYKTRKNLISKSQIKDLDNLIKENELKLTEKNRYKESLLGLTAEKYADRCASNYYIVKSLFVDNELKSYYLNEKDFNQLDDEELVVIINAFNEGTTHLEFNNIKKTALSSTFQNLYSINDNPYYFLGKFVSRLTYYQTTLLSYGSFFRNVLSELGDSVDEKTRHNPDELEKLFLATRNQNKERAKYSKGKTEFFGEQEVNAQSLREAELLSSRGFNSIEALNQGIL